MSTATSARRKSSGSSAIAPYTACASSASSGRSRRSAVGKVELLDAGRDLRAPRRGAPRGQERVAQHPHEVGELVVAAQQTRAREHAREGLLNEVLGVVGRAAQGPRRPVEAVDVSGQRLGVKARHGRSTHA